MKKGLDKYLVKKYPKIFVDRYENMQKTAMCWWFEHGDGWFWLLDQLCDSIQSYIDSNSKRTVIKNKFLEKLVKRLRKSSSKYSRFKIIRKLLKHRGTFLRKIANYIDDKSEKIEIETITQVVATQVKEKFGTLNFYYIGGDNMIDGMVWLAENMSANVCEFCGSTNNVGYTEGWISTICEECYSNSSMSNNWKERKTTKEIRKIKLNTLS